MNPEILSKVKASVRIVPTGSHVVILSLVIVLGICLTFVYYLISNNQDYWPLLIFSGFVLIVIVVFWLRSHRDIDISPDSMIEISKKNSTGSKSISIPARGVLPVKKLEDLERIVSTMMYSSPLPEPDGLIDHQGNPIPDSSEEAKRRVLDANNQIKVSINEFISNPNQLDSSMDVVQKKLENNPDIREVRIINRSNEES